MFNIRLSARKHESRRAFTITTHSRIPTRDSSVSMNYLITVILLFLPQQIFFSCYLGQKRKSHFLPSELCFTNYKYFFEVYYPLKSASFYFWYRLIFFYAIILAKLKKKSFNIMYILFKFILNPKYFFKYNYPYYIFKKWFFTFYIFFSILSWTQNNFFKPNYPY